MGKENSARKISSGVVHRKKLADITNTPLLLKSRIHEENDQFAHKDAFAQLQEELDSVKNMLAEKELMLAESKRCTEKLWCSYCRKSKQNEEIILHNSELYRDLSQARDQLKILQHENAQVSAVYKAYRMEMQEKLNDALEQVDRLTKDLEASHVKKASYKDYTASTLSGQFLCDHGPEDLDILRSISSLRKKERRGYREPSLKAKMRHGEKSSTYQNESFQRRDSDFLKSGLGELKVNEATFAGFVSASWKSTSVVLDKKEICSSERQQCIGQAQNATKPRKALPTEKVENVTKAINLPTATLESSSRPQRRAASSIGSYKEPTLKSKMRRAD